MKNYILTERVNLFEPNVYINFLVEIEGNPTSDELISAVNTAFQANDATMSKVVLESDGSAFFERIPKCECKISVSSADWQEIIRENEKIPFEIGRGEMMRVFIIQSDNETKLLIMVHHLIGDGKSVIYFIEDIMKALSGEALKFKPMNLITKNSFTKESELPFLMKSYINSVNKKWNRTPKHFTWEDYYKIHNKYWSEHTSQILCHTFSEDELVKIQTRAKSAKVSINSYIVTAFLKEKTRKGALGIPVSVRDNLDKSMSNLASGIIVKHSYSHKKSFDKNVQIVHDEIYKNLKSPVMKYFVLRFVALLPPSLIDSVLMHTHGLYSTPLVEKFAKVMGYVGKNKREAGITNLTKIDILTKYGQYKIKNITFIPPAVSYAKNIIGVSTINGRMTITYHFTGDQNESPQDFFCRGIMNLRECEKL